MHKVEHTGIIVKSLECVIPLFEKLLNNIFWKSPLVESEKVNTAFFKYVATKIELLESTTTSFQQILIFRVVLKRQGG
jgi:methylmalonyl-CoA/ethylmalonyl-CoA epimerase